MCLRSMRHKWFCALIFAIGLFSCAVCQGARGGGVYNNGGGYNRGDYNGGGYNNGVYNHDYYNGGNWGAPAVVVGVPGADYDSDYQTTCSTTEQCDSDGNCSQNQVCN